MPAMPAIEAQFRSLPGGGILYDAARVRHPGAQLFQQGHWVAHNAVREVSGGRGSVSFIAPGNESTRTDDAWVWRHYRRGGLVARLLQDRYLFTGAERTRCFREWRLLARLIDCGLPVPEPIAARFLRSGLTYTADLLTAELPPSLTLAQSLGRAALSSQQWQSIGRTLAAFHLHGVQHADLNAHNILLGTSAADQVFVLDFDRGRIREPGDWEQRVLQRLRRSLEKISAQLPPTVFGKAQWGWLMEGMAAGKAVGCRL